MKVRINLLLIVFVYTLVGLPVNAVAQEDSILAKVRVSDEVIRLETHPVIPDRDAGVSMAKLAKDRLFQSDLTLVEIPAGGQAPPDRHLTEEIIYIVSGSGYTTMWTQPGENPLRYDWKAGDVIIPSLNAWHQHFNSSANAPARYVSMTSSPLINNQFSNPAFINGVEFIFEDRWQYGISQKPEYKGSGTMDMKIGHYLSDVPGRELQSRNDSKGITTRPQQGDLAGNRILQLLVREYQAGSLLPLDGHTHPWETTYLVLQGEGSTLLKRGEEPARLVNWEKGDLIIVEANEYHDNGARPGKMSAPPYPRLLQMRPSGYFFGVGNVGEEDHSPVRIDR